MMFRILALILLASPVIAQPVFMRDSVQTLRDNDDDFGGFSGIHVFENGIDFLMITDRGKLQNGRFQRRNGSITAIEFAPLIPILDTKGQPLDSFNTDAEGLAIAPDGSLLISFESNNRVMRHASQTSPAEFLPKHPDFNQLQTNSGLEALAVDANGTVYAMPERSGDLDRAFPVYRFQNNRWDTDLQVPRRPPFLMVGADILDGKLYILERHLAGLAGFSTRIRRFTIGDSLFDEQVLFTSRSGQFDNLEGISVWQDPMGQIRATVVSDDNFNFFQRSQIVEFVLRD
ncbi:MAG: esterase-like activity of phytase family protein [Rhodobacteraceae bacterium]|nr:esterase-like activity of phytase family protein [Paracoccaceae bacterium]